MDNKSVNVLVLVIVWCKSANKPLPEPKLRPSSLTQLCVSRTQWVKRSMTGFSSTAKKRCLYWIKILLAPYWKLSNQIHLADANAWIFINLQMVYDIHGICKKDVAPLLTHRSYVFLALTNRYFLCLIRKWNLLRINYSLKPSDKNWGQRHQSLYHQSPVSI